MHMEISTRQALERKIALCEDQNSQLLEQSATISQQELKKSQQELTNSQQELKKSQQELTNSQQELKKSQQKLVTSQEEYNQLEHHLYRLLGESTALENVSIEECEEIEKTLKNALQKIDAKKTILIKNNVRSHTEQRMCVICQEHEKSVVLLPCRHLCLCADCSQHNLLTHCPLCREIISQRISVFS